MELNGKVRKDSTPAQVTPTIGASPTAIEKGVLIIVRLNTLQSITNFICENDEKPKDLAVRYFQTNNEKYVLRQQKHKEKERKNVLKIIDFLNHFYRSPLSRSCMNSDSQSVSIWLFPSEVLQ